MVKYFYFKKGNLDIHLEDGSIINAPGFVDKSAKNYRFDRETLTLEKKCIQCNTYFSLKKIINGVFVDIHDENLIHFFSETSGFQGKCNSCLSKNTDFSHSECDLPIDTTLSEKNQTYIRMIALIKNQTEESALNQIVDLVRKHNTIDYNEKIK